MTMKLKPQIMKLSEKTTNLLGNFFAPYRWKNKLNLPICNIKK